MPIDILSALAVVLGLVGAAALWLGERQSFVQLKLGGVGMMVVAIGALLLGTGPSRPLGGELSLLEGSRALVKVPGLAVELGLDPAGASSGGSLSPAGETGYFTISDSGQPLPFRVPDSPHDPSPDPGPDPEPDPVPTPTPLPSSPPPPINNTPEADADSATTSEDSSVVINVLANDSDPDGDPLTVSGLSNPPNGSVSNDGGGSVTYTPGPGFAGGDSFTYDACDPGGLCDQATVSITVTAVNEAPVANGDSATTPQDTSVDINVLANDSDPDGDPLNVSGLSDPPNGSAVNNGNGTVTYTPELSFVGEDSFTYDACDPGGLCNQATVSVTVTGSLGVHVI